MLDQDYSQYIPFMSLMAGNPQNTPLITKMIETAVMSVVAGAVGVYVGVEVIKNDLTYLKAGISETNQKVEKLDEKVEQLRRDLYVPRATR